MTTVSGGFSNNGDWFVADTGGYPVTIGTAGVTGDLDRLIESLAQDVKEAEEMATEINTKVTNKAENLLTIRCSAHPTYTAQRTSRNECETCQLLYTIIQKAQIGQVPY